MQHTHISPQEFAKELYHASLTGALKERVLKALPRMDAARIERIYRILKSSRIHREQGLLQLDIHCSQALQQLETTLNEAGSNHSQS